MIEIIGDGLILIISSLLIIGSLVEITRIYKNLKEEDKDGK